MKNSSVLLLLLLLCMAGHSQVRYFVQGGANLGLLPTTENGALYSISQGGNPVAEMTIATRSTFSKRPGGYLAGGIQYEVHPRLYVEGTWSFSLLRYRQQNKYLTATRVYDDGQLPGGSSSESLITFYQAGSPLPPASFSPPAGMYFSNSRLPQWVEHGNANKAGMAQLLYADLAITAKYRFWRRSHIGLGGGLTGLLSGSAHNQRREYKSADGSGEVSEVTVYYEKQRLRHDLNPVTVFLQGVLEQGLNDNWSVQAGFSLYLSPLYRNIPAELNTDKAKMRLLTLGARYYFSHK